ncbi:hypothetical protein LCGC14_0452450 [marine sediment metagenome]|uniref:Uncharacterized protein n=1 Tax=marine sediment metagenome TaxID=412755 RepID=A0A0F9SN05_9ZZZZ
MKTPTGVAIMGGMSQEDFEKLKAYLKSKSVPNFGEIVLIFQNHKLVRVKKEESQKIN